MTPTVWLIYDHYDNCVVDVCATAEDCACHLVDMEMISLDDDCLHAPDWTPQHHTYMTIREAAQNAGKTNLDYLVDMLERKLDQILPYHIEEEHVLSGYNHILK